MYTNFGTREEMTNDSALVARNLENTKTSLPYRVTHIT